MILRPFFITFLLATVFLGAQGQTVSLRYDQVPLNEVLLDLNTRFQVPISINADLSSQCFVSLDDDFANIEDGLKAVANHCQLELELVNDVYSFQRDKSSLDQDEDEPISYVFQGKVVDRETGEPIPFSALIVGENQLISDQHGFFSVESEEKELLVYARSLGYSSLDTMVVSNNFIQLLMTENALALEEVVILENPEEEVSHIGAYAAQFKMNDVSNQLIPGQNINAVFNNIKMFPGITSSGESLSDYLIWGSYSGQNLTLFDDIVIFNSWGINDDIGRINPLMVRNIEVFKGGYGADYGDRVGGLIRIDGKQGDTSRPTGEINISNQLAMMHVSVPLLQGSSVLQVAGRQSYFDVLDWSAEQKNPSNGAIIPQYKFQDLNVKWSTNFANGDLLQVSVIHSQDNYEGLQTAPENRRLERNIEIGSDQTGFSAKYVKQWDQTGYSTITFAQSEFNPESQINFLSTEVNEDVLRSSLWLNSIRERSLKWTHQWPLKGTFQVKVGAGTIENESFLETPAEILSESADQSLLRYFGFVHSDFQMGKSFLLKASLRGDLVGGDIYAQPRISGIWDITSRWLINASWGKYNQFISHISTLDYIGNNSNYWQVFDPETDEPVEAYHHIVGTTYKLNSLMEFNLTGYLINQDNARSLAIDRERNARMLMRESQSMGVDAMSKIKIGQQQLILGYSLNQTLERFGLNRIPDSRSYREAPQSQRHELKATGIFKIGRLNTSVSSVYGSGFPTPAPVRSEDLRVSSIRNQPAPTNPSTQSPPRVERRILYRPYWRTDVAVEYPWSMLGLDWAAGTSVINLFNYRNIRLNQSLVVPDNSTINTLGEPLTLTAYLKISF